MSHFSLLVITEEYPTESILSSKLSRFNENMEVPQYIRYTKQQLIEHQKEEVLKAKEKYELYKKDPENNKMNEEYYLQTYPRLIKAMEENDEASLYLQAIRYYEEDEFDNFGNVLSTYNPDSKWDWYVVGGRFSNEISSKSDTIQVKDFPYKKINEKNLEKEYPNEYLDYKDLLSGKKNSFYNLKYLNERYPTFLDYILEIKTITTYAVLDEDDNWHEPGTVGWFGFSTATTKDEVEWTKNYYNNFIKHLPLDYYLTVVDCHI